MVSGAVVNPSARTEKTCSYVLFASFGPDGYFYGVPYWVTGPTWAKMDRTVWVVGTLDPYCGGNELSNTLGVFAPPDPPES